MNTRVDAGGNKVLHLEEVQSDWGQKGRKEGFAPSISKRLIAKSQGAGTNMYEVYENDKLIWRNVYAVNEKEAIGKVTNTGIPSAPFITDTNAWVKFGLKIALKEAVAQGVDKITWTSGTTQFDRWGSERAWKNQRGKKTLLSLTLVRRCEMTYEV